MPFSMTGIDGQLYFGNNARPISWNSIPEYTEFENKVQNEVLKNLSNKQTTTFNCEIQPQDIFDIEKLFGIKKKKIAKPERKRLLKKLRDKYGWFRTNDYTLIPKGNGQWNMIINGLNLGNCVLGFDIGKEEHYYGN